MPTARKQIFTGGINQQLDETKIDASQDCFLLINSRTRRGVIDPIDGSVEITSGLPPGKIQGLYASENTLLAFVSGLAYYRILTADRTGETWNPIRGFDMSTEQIADEIEIELVPASTINFAYKVDAQGNRVIGNPVGGSPQCVICMDGFHQPWVIFPNGTSRVTQNYSEWTTTLREYVPIAKHPFFYNGVLYCAIRDKFGKFTQMGRSVTGRPLDFIIAVDKDGNKISTDETLGGAPVMTGGFSTYDITGFSAINATDGAFLGTTYRNTTLITPDSTNLIYGEPQFRYQPLFTVGAQNNHSITDILGDTAIIHFNGIRSFNGVTSQKWEGRNAPFSAKINSLLDGIYQTGTAAIGYDNYALFAVQTKHGPATLVFDTLQQRFVSVDLHDSAISQFAVGRTLTEERLFYRTADDSIYEAYASDKSTTCGIYFNDWVPSSKDTKSRHKITEVSLVFTDVLTDGYLQCEVFHDRHKSNAQVILLEAQSQPSGLYKSIPFDSVLDLQATRTVNVNWVDSPDISRVFYAWRVGCMITWSARATLLDCSVLTDERAETNPDRVLSNPVSLVDPVRVIFIGNDGALTQDRALLNSLLKSYKPDLVVGLGGQCSMAGNQSEIDTLVKPYWDYYHNQGRFLATLGPKELGFATGQEVFEYLDQPPSNYFVKPVGWADLFIMQDGIRQDNSQAFSYNLDGIVLKTSSQWVWLQNALKNSTARFKLVVWHHPPYSSSGGEPSMQEDFLPVAQWGADSVIGGYHRQYERLHVNNKVYFVCGTGGQPIQLLDRSLNPLSYAGFSELGFLQAMIYPLSIEFSFISHTGVVLDQWVIRK